MTGESRPLRLWAFGDAHVGTDKLHGRSSLAEAISQSEFGGVEGGPAFPWDIAIDVGDMSGAHHSLPDDAEGEEVVKQLSALRTHRREDIYSVCGNHDRSGLDEPEAWWWQRWIDPLGENTEFSGVDPAARPYGVEGSWERYAFRVGNLLFLMMSDRNEPTQHAGRGTLGGNPGGVVSGETFDWWASMVDDNPEAIIVSAHHYVLKDTTVASVSGRVSGVLPPANWWSTTTDRSSRARPMVRRICTGWTASRTRPRSNPSWPPDRAGWRYGSPATRTPTRRTRSAARRISNSVGGHGSSTSRR